MLEYIVNNETDFISFKIKLLLGQVGDDPIERAKLITDIVKSISLIPDTITRSVYVRETAAQMQVEEKILYTEIARIRKEITGESAVGQGYYHTSQQPVVPVVQPVKVLSENSCDIEEIVLIRYLLLFGSFELYEEQHDGVTRSVSVGEYIIDELAEDELEMFHPHLNAIQKEYRANYKTPGFLPAKFFIGHRDVNISQVVADIISEPYELSKIWTLKDNSMKTEEMMLSELLPKIVDNYKMRRVEMMVREADNKILELQNNGGEEILEWIRKKNNINKIRAKLNEKLGRTGVR